MKKKTPALKPNGKPVGTFIVSIDDGFCEWSYELPIRKRYMSVNLVYERIRKAFHCKATSGVQRR